ncbi:hypothetical protein D3C84_781550 [compost metagenome]
MSATAENTDARKSPKKPGKAKPADAGSVIRTNTVTAAHRLNETPAQKAYGTARVSAASATGMPIVDLLLPDTNTDNRMEVFKATQSGFPLSSVIQLVESVETFKRHNVLAKIVGLSERTLARRMKNKDEALSPEQSARALYYAEVLEKAQEVFGTRALAEEWMTRPALGLDGESPIDLLSNPVGYELVTDFLNRLDYGVY